MESRFVCGMIWRYNSQIREVEFLVIDAMTTISMPGRPSARQIKFPGGVNRVPDEPIELTLQREILEETYLACLPAHATQVWKKDVGGGHTKYGFVVASEYCRGELRKDFLDDHGDKMGPPRWERVSVLKHEIFRGHQEPLTKALEYLESQGAI